MLQLLLCQAHGMGVVLRMMYIPCIILIFVVLIISIGVNDFTKIEKESTFIHVIYLLVSILEIKYSSSIFFILLILFIPKKLLVVEFRISSNCKLLFKSSLYANVNSVRGFNVKNSQPCGSNDWVISLSLLLIENAEYGKFEIITINKIPK